MVYIPSISLANDGFRLDDANRRIKDTSLISLSIAFKSYFNTYVSMYHNLNAIENPEKYKFKKEEVDYNYRHKYFENYSESIIHFHHSFEVLFKRILIENFSQPDESISGMEFSRTVDTLCKLISSNLIGNSQYLFICNAEKWLKDLNYLRNRLLHRGLYILRYVAFDELVGRYIIPFVLELKEIFKHDFIESLWLYKGIDCGIDPISEIVEIFKNENYNIGKVAFLKELARASYNNMIPSIDWEKYTRNEYIGIMENAAQEYKLNIDDVVKCPVCGLKTLLVYFDSDGDIDEEANDGTYKCYWEYIYEVKCIQCSFEIHDTIKNAKEYGYSQVSDFFWSKYK